MVEIKELLKIIFGLAAIAGCLWLYLKVSAFLYERGWIVRRMPKLEIQTIFHGNTKDKDQI